MIKSGIKNRITALLLIGMMALSMTGYAFESVYADVEEDQPADNMISTEALGNGDSEESSELQPAAETASDTETLVEEVQTSGTGDEEPELIIEDPQGEIILNTAGEDGGIKVAWKPFESDKYTDIYYKVFLDGEKVFFDSEKTIDKTTECKCSLNNVSADAHTVTVRAYSTKEVEPTDQSQSGPVTVEIQLAEGSADNALSSGRNRIGHGATGAVNLGINLKTLIGESHDGYSVVQGGCTDGTYNYYLMVSSTTQDGRILKLRRSDNAVIGASGVIDIEHGNGMCMDTDNRRLVISNREGYKNILITVNADTLSDVKYYGINYGENKPWTSTAGKGIAAISYVEKYKCFIALQRNGFDLLVLRQDSVDQQNFDVVAFIGTTIQANYPGTYQAMDADSRYVYLLQSYYNSSHPYNQMIVLDWNAENLGIRTDWKCKNNESGEPDTVIRIDSPYEAENIYHIDRGDGTADFYMSEYFNNPKTKTVTKQETYKVKWKKVWKKVPVKKKYKKKVKWKKVQTKNGKWKWKYKKVTKYKTVYKKKKVWKYKTKTKEVKVKQSYLNRDDFVYYIGTF